jgi:hypothetical protein
MCHEVTGLVFMEVIQRECLEVRKETVAQGFFDSSRSAEEKVAPEKAGYSDEESNY